MTCFIWYIIINISYKITAVFYFIFEILKILLLSKDKTFLKNLSAFWRIFLSVPALVCLLILTTFCVKSLGLRNSFFPLLPNQAYLGTYLQVIWQNKKHCESYFFSLWDWETWKACLFQDQINSKYITNLCSNSLLA